MQPSTLRLSLAGLAALLTVGLWFCSQNPWTEHWSITSQIDWSGTREFERNDRADGIGATYYLVTNSLLLLAALVIMGAAWAGDSADKLPGGISIGVAILAGIAYVRWRAEFDALPSSQLLSTGGGGHNSAASAEITGVLAVILFVLGLALLWLGQSPKIAAAAPIASPP